MDPLVEFLWKRRGDGRPPEEASNWACDLLERGVESDAILLLAADSQMDSRDQQELLTQAIRDLGMERLLDPKTLRDEYAAAFQKDLIASFYAGHLDGESLLDQCLDLYYDAGKPDKMAFWVGVGADSGQHGGQGICLAYPFDERPFDEALEIALTANGYPRPS
jgi:hypothetical protein